MNEINYIENVAPEAELKITPDVKTNLLSASRWAKFLSITGFVFTGLMVVLAIVFIIAGHAFHEAHSGWDMAYNMRYASNMSGVVMGFTYLTMAAIYFFPCLFLFRFADKTKNAMLSGTQTSFSAGMSNLKNLYQYMGILTIVGIDFFAIIMFFMVIFLMVSPTF